jgi:hypothetical protein
LANTVNFIVKNGLTVGNTPVIASNGTYISAIANTGVQAGIYGNTTSIPVITVGADGRLTNISNAAFSIAGSFLSNVGDRVTANLGTIFTFSNTQSSTSTTTGSIIVNGGLGVAGNVYANGVYDNGVELLTLTNSKATVYNTASAPTSANVDDIWIDPNTGIEYVYISSNSASQWVEFGPLGTPQNVTANLQFADQTIFATYNTRDIIIQNIGSTGGIKLNASNTSFSGNVIIKEINSTPPLQVISSNGYYTQTPTSAGYIFQATGIDGSTARVVVDSASIDGSAYSNFTGRNARGTHQNPSAVQSGDLLTKFSGNGYGTTGYAINSGGASIEIYATENYTDLAKGSKLVIATTPVGSNVRATVATFSANNITMTGNVIANASNSLSNFYNLKIDGSLTYAYQIDTANTTQYINYNTQELQFAPITGTTTLVHQNIAAGRKVVLVAKNTSGSDYTINLSVPVNNCTATRDKNGKYSAPANTVTMFAGTTLFLTFFAFGTSTSNVYCSITPT